MHLNWKIHLETERVLLREFNNDDVDNLYELDSDPQVVFFIPQKNSSKKEIREIRIPKFLNYYSQGKELGYWAAHEKNSKEFMGFFHFRPGVEGEEGLELGYRLGRKYWGKGYATEVSKAILKKAVELHSQEKVFSCALKENISSIRVMEKTGLKFVKELPYNEHSDGKPVVYYEAKISKYR